MRSSRIYPDKDHRANSLWTLCTPVSRPLAPASSFCGKRCNATISTLALSLPPIRIYPNICRRAGKARQWLSGFTGSVGTLVVTRRVCRFVRRQPLLVAGRNATGRQRHRADEDPGRQQRCCTSTGWPAICAGGQTVAVDGEVLGLAGARALRAGAASARHRAAHRLSICWTTSGPTGRRCRPRRWLRTRRAARDRWRAPTSWRRCATRCAAHGADCALHLDGRRHRVAVQPARRRRQLQPGLPRARAGRRDSARRCSSAEGKVAGRAARARWRPTASSSRRTRSAAAALAALPAGAALLIDPRRITLGLREQVPRGVQGGRGDQPEHASPRAARATPKRRMCARRWSRTAPRCASSTPGSSTRSRRRARSPS